MAGTKTAVLLFALLQVCLAARPIDGHLSHGRFHVRRDKDVNGPNPDPVAASPEVEHQLRERQFGGVLPPWFPSIVLPGFPGEPSSTSVESSSTSTSVESLSTSLQEKAVSTSSSTKKSSTTSTSTKTTSSVKTTSSTKAASTSTKSSSSSTKSSTTSTKSSSSTKASSTSTKASSTSTKATSTSAKSSSTSAKSSTSSKAASTSAKTTSSTSTKATTSSVDTKVAVISSTTSKTTTSTVKAPIPGNATIHGAATSLADERYVPSQKSAALPTLQPLETSTPGPNSNLSLNYPIFNGTGSLTVVEGTESSLKPLKYNPLLSRDGGKGGNINGVNFFIFADTDIASPANGSTLGTFEGFVSNSVAVDVGLGPASGKALTIQDGAGEWCNNAGTMRGFIPMTTGEQKYNTLFETKGQRYAIWPETSIIPVTNDTAVMFAPIIYSDSNTTSGTVTFPYAGSTQVLVTIPNPDAGGPVATRPNPLMWGSTDVEWGCVGGIRSWGASGVGGTDGNIYIFGAVTKGLLMARVPAVSVTDKTQYEYYAGSGNWTTTVPTTKSTNYFIQGPFSTVDIFYSPMHKTFICVYMDYYTDNSFYWMYLKAPALTPGYAGGSMEDFVEAMYTYTWSSAVLLFKAPAPSTSYNYGGGMHQGYFGDDDILNGGNRMLLTWTHPTGKNAMSATTGYQLVSAEVQWS